MKKKYYLIAVKLNNRSFITPDPPIYDLSEAESLASKYFKSGQWQGVEIVTVWHDGTEIERHEYKVNKNPKIIEADSYSSYFTGEPGKERKRKKRKPSTGEKVIFRKWWNRGVTYIDPDDYEIIALFPEIDVGMGYIQSYMHVGQHGHANYDWVMSQTEPATPSEYRDLKKELEHIGYKLRVINIHRKKDQFKYMSKLADMLMGPVSLSYNEWAKAKFKEVGIKAMEELGWLLELNRFETRFNPGGIAVSGDIVLMGMWNRYIGIYVLLNKGVMRSGYYRAIQHMQDYTGGVNHQLSYRLLKYPYRLKTLMMKLKGNL